MEAEKSLHLSQESWCFSSSSKEEEKPPSQFTGSQAGLTWLTWGTVSLLELVRPSTDWTRPIHTGRGPLLCPVHELNVHLIQTRLDH